MRACFAAGQLSYSKVRALTRVATPETEEALLEMARQGTAAHLERIVRAYRRAQRVDELDRANRVHEGRSLRWYHDDDGAFVLQARLTPEHGALVRKALERARRRLWMSLPRKTHPQVPIVESNATPTPRWPWPSPSWPWARSRGTAAIATW